MKTVEKVPTEVTKITWFCDVCGKNIGENTPKPSARCTHCGKDVCQEHIKHFSKRAEYQQGFYHRMGPSISISLCDECRKIEFTYEVFLELFFKEVNIRGRPRPI